MRCPKCGHSFNSRASRVTCHKCGTSWNTSGGTGINGPAVFIVGLLAASFAPVLGFWMMVGGAAMTYGEHKG